MKLPLGRNIREARLARGLSLDKAAKQIGVCKSHLWEVEQGISANPTIGNVIAYSDFYQIPIEVLVGRDGGTQ